MKQRLDKELLVRGLVTSRSQAESYIRLGKVEINGKTIDKTGHFVTNEDKIVLAVPKDEQYVGRAAMKLASVAEVLKLDFKDKLVLDVGSSTGGFTDYALKHGAKAVIAVDVGTEQMHPTLRNDSRVELHEKTDIRSLRLRNNELGIKNKEEKEIHNSKFIILDSAPDLVLVDVSFISLREVLPSINILNKSSTQIIILLKPQFEAGNAQINKGIVKNDKLRRQILKDFEMWVKEHFTIVAKADSKISGVHGNRERFYLLQPKSK